MAVQMGSSFKHGVVLGFLSLSVLLLFFTMLTHTSKYYFSGSLDLSNQKSLSFTFLKNSSNIKKSLLTVVVSSLRDRKSLSVDILNTWGSNSYNGRFDHVILTAVDSNATEVPANVVELEHEDLPSFVQLNHEELTYILSKMRELYLSEYWWFLLVPSNTYVSYKDIEAVTASIDPREVVYMGHPAKQPDDDQQYCQLGPGILMSYGTLLRTKEVENCVLEQEDSTASDAALGSCLDNLLQVQCSNADVDLEKAFVYDVSGRSSSPENLWEDDTYQSIATLYPIRDPYQLDAVHIWNQVREISQHQVKAWESLEKLKKNEMCSSSIPECGLRPEGKLLSNISYADLTSNCPLFTHGYEPESLRELDTWDVTVAGKFYSGKTVEQSSILEPWLSELTNYTTAVAMEIVKARSPGLELAWVGTCYTRHRAMLGQEFIYDLQLVKRRKKSGIMKKRVAFRLPFKQKFLWWRNTRVIKNMSETVVNVVVPLSATVSGDRVVSFMRDYQRLCNWLDGKCRIIFIVFDNADKQSFSLLKNTVTKLSNKYPYLIRHVVYFTDKYDKTKKYNSGMWLLADKELAVLADVDVTMDKKFLDRCRQYAIPHRQVYYPNTFQYYNMKYVYNDTWHPRKPSLSRKHGHWVKGSVVCLYKSDYVTLGEYQEIYKWEWQPDLSKKGSLAVIQSPDPGLTRTFRELKCSKNLSKRKKRRCLSASVEHLGDRAILANYAISLKERCAQSAGSSK